MPRGETRRTRRVAALIQVELAEIILRKVRDPRLAMISITGVDVAPDMSQAKVFYSLLDDGSQADARRGFLAAAGFLRRELAHRLHLKVMPRLVPVYDVSLKRGAEMDLMIRRALRDDAARSGRAGEDEA